MELWIRSQNKIVLMKVDEICYAEAYKDEHSLWYRDILLGKYDTEKRALEVLDEIQNILQPRVIIHEPEIYNDDIINSLAKNIVIQTSQKIETELKQAGQIVYEMPEE